MPATRSGTGWAGKRAAPTPARPPTPTREQPLEQVDASNALRHRLVEQPGRPDDRLPVDADQRAAADRPGELGAAVELDDLGGVDADVLVRCAAAQEAANHVDGLVHRQRV